MSSATCDSSQASVQITRNSNSSYFLLPTPPLSPLQAKRQGKITTNGIKPWKFHRYLTSLQNLLPFVASAPWEILNVQLDIGLSKLVHVDIKYYLNITLIHPFSCHAWKQTTSFRSHHQPNQQITKKLTFVAYFQHLRNKLVSLIA